MKMACKLGGLDPLAWTHEHWGQASPLVRSPHAENGTALPPEFRAEAVELMQSGTNSIGEQSPKVAISNQRLGNWSRQAEIDAARRPQHVVVARASPTK